jgi:hypothetical protein
MQFHTTKKQNNHHQLYMDETNQWTQISQALKLPANTTTRTGDQNIYNQGIEIPPRNHFKKKRLIL